ncbi:hypothetical protein [Aurantibacillus circumpalustris]|uniref:hypothetical protein n=1 Tax=Aurantibacillus circumpalustris TaxID=3036359 RepID=UPI00295B36D5|nr:hypothetical protein [Aurantibacillus circumpalustris]
MKQILSVLMLLFFLTDTAQIIHSETPVCTTKKAGNFLIELAGCNNYIDIYLYDLKEKPVRGIELNGKAEFHYLDETFSKADFVQYGRTNSLRAEIPGPGFYNFKVTLVIKNDTITTYFDNTCDLRAQAKK